MSRIIRLPCGCDYCRTRRLLTLDDRDLTWCENKACEAFFDIGTL